MIQVFGTDGRVWDGHLKFSRTYIKVSFLLAVYGYNIIFIPASWRSRWFWPWCEMCHSKLNSNGDLYDVVWFAISTKTTFGSGLQRLLMVVMKIKFYLLGFSLWRKQKIWPTQGEIGAQDCPSAIQTLRRQCKGIIFDTFLGFSEAKDIYAFFTSHSFVIHIL